MTQDNNLGEALKTNDQPVDQSAVVGYPVQVGFVGYQMPPPAGYAPQPAGYPQYGAASVGYAPQGYPPQFPAYNGAAPPGYPYPPGYPGGFAPQSSPPTFGGTSDEKYAVSMEGICAEVPGLVVPDLKRNLRIVFIMFFFVAFLMITMGIVLISTIRVFPYAGIAPCVMGAIFLLVILRLYCRTKRYQSRAEDNITPQNTQAFLAHVAMTLQASTPQLEIIRMAMQRANPTTPHKFVVMRKMRSAFNDDFGMNAGMLPSDPRYNHMGRGVSSYTSSCVLTFNTRGLPPSHLPQLHAFSLV